MHQPPLKYRAWQPRATLTLPSTVLQRPVYNAVFTARLVGYLNCDLGGGGSSSRQIRVECAASIHTCQLSRIRH